MRRIFKPPNLILIVSVLNAVTRRGGDGFTDDAEWCRPFSCPVCCYNNFVIYTMIAGYWSDLGPFLFEESEIAALVSLGNEGVI